MLPMKNDHFTLRNNYDKKGSIYIRAFSHFWDPWDPNTNYPQNWEKQKLRVGYVYIKKSSIQVGGGGDNTPPQAIWVGKIAHALKG